MESLRGQLLVASPKILDANFRRTVVFVAEHSADGALGLVLNRPAGATVSEAVPDLRWLTDEDDGIWIGGPVAQSSVMVLAQFHEPARAAVIVTGDLGLVPAEMGDPDDFAGAVRRARIFAGHAGWGSGQLEAELDDDDWIVVSSRPDDVFCPDPDALWSRVLRRKGPRYELLATMPMDPTLN